MGKKTAKIFAKVHEFVKKIPKGQVTTYGWVGRQVGVSPRVVGWALHGNKDPQISCHRVVNREGRVAVNYAFGGGGEQKKKLLLEGVTFVDATHVDLEKNIWEDMGKNGD